MARIGRFGVGRPLRGKLVNLSQTGVLMQLVEPVEPGKDVEIEMTPIGGGRATVLQATVRRCVGKGPGAWDVGCQFFTSIEYGAMMIFCGGVAVRK